MFLFWGGQCCIVENSSLVQACMESSSRYSTAIRTCRTLTRNSRVFQKNMYSLTSPINYSIKMANSPDDLFRQPMLKLNAYYKIQPTPTISARRTGKKSRLDIYGRTKWLKCLTDDREKCVRGIENRKKPAKADEGNYICPLMSTTLYAWDLASSNTRPALPVKSRTCPSLSCSSSPEAYSRTKRALCSSDSKPSSSVMKRIFTSGLYLRRKLATVTFNRCGIRARLTFYKCRPRQPSVRGRQTCP